MSESLPSRLLGQAGWVNKIGRWDDLVISSRVRLARNIRGKPFSHWASSSDLERVASSALEALRCCTAMRDSDAINAESLEPSDRKYLVERYLISRELAEGGLERWVVIDGEEVVSVMVNEEDHLRLQVLLAGLNVVDAWQRVDRLDDELSQNLDYAFSPKYGYLTACPTNVGTGIRVSVMVHLPGLVMTQEIKKVLSAVSQIGLTVRGFAGEGSEISGNLFQISNQWTLGASEEETLEKIERILDQIVEKERQAQERLWSENRSLVEDRVYRAYGLLSHARIISTKEALELLSQVRLGLNLGLFGGITYSGMSDVIIALRPAHLSRRVGRSLSTAERDVERARLLRSWIASRQGGAGNG